MNRRKLELLVGAVSGAVGLAAALHTAVIAGRQEPPGNDAEPTEGAGKQEDANWIPTKL